MPGNFDSPSSQNNIDQLNQQAWDIRIVDSNQSQQLSRQVIELAEKSNYAKGKAEALRTYGFCLIRLSLHQEANACLEQALSIFESLNDVRGLSTVYEYFGIIQRSWGNLGASLEYIFKAIPLSQQAGFTESETTNYYQLGVTYRSLGNYEKALDNLFKSLSLSRSINFSLMAGYAINVIGSVYFETGDYTQALDYYQQGLLLRRQSGDKWGEAGSLDNIGSTYLKLNDEERAIDFCKQSLAINKNTGDKKGQANALLHLAEIYKQRRDWQLAVDSCTESLQIRHAIGDKKGEAEVLLISAELQRAHFKKEDKDRLFEPVFKALEISEEIESIDLSAKAHWALYESYKIYGNYEKALDQLELHIDIEKKLHKDAISQKVLNLEISHRAEESEKEAEIFRLRNVELVQALTELKATQSQLIQSEKMASLGELTAGIAHEIQNPLNFVNNFSEVNSELIKEMKEEIDNGNLEEVKIIADNIDENERKILHHGKRADGIVKGMLQHSRSSSNIKEPTDINSLADEYLRLGYHGLRAKDKSFNVKLTTDFDERIGKINIVPQDIGRVLLNLYNNAFYAVKTPNPHQLAGEHYEPTVTVSTKLLKPPPASGGLAVLISVKDNGNGIPKKVVDKIFQPFFTTKPTGEGTGLGLSLSYDIIKAHGGEIKVETKEGEGTEFVISLPFL